MSEDANKQNNGQQVPPPVAFQQDYLASEMSSRVLELRRALGEKRAECLRIEGQIGEAQYWLQLIQTAQPAQQPTGDAAQGGPQAESNAKGE